MMRGIRSILVRGAGRHFSTGGNVASFFQEVAAGPDHLATIFRDRLRVTAGMVEAILGFDRPIVASIRGGVAGAGLLFALAADVVLADETAMFLFAHQRIGLTPDAGVSYLLPRAVGRREARRLVLTAAKLDATEAARLGLVHLLVDPAALDDETAKLTTQFCRAPQQAMKRAKLLLGGRRRGHPLVTNSRPKRMPSSPASPIRILPKVSTAFIEKRAARFPSASP